MQKVNLFCKKMTTNIQFTDPQKNCVNWLRASCWFLCLEKSAITFGEGCSIHVTKIHTKAWLLNVSVYYLPCQYTEYFLLCEQIHTRNVYTNPLADWFFLPSSYNVWWFAVAFEPNNCADVIRMNSRATDGKYWLYRGDGPIRLYCHKMTGIPQAYITLRDPESNYGEDLKYSAHTKFSRVAVDPQVWYHKMPTLPAKLDLQ